MFILVRGGKVIRDMKYLMRSFKRASEAVGIWTEENWDAKRVNSLYTMVSGRFVSKEIRGLVHLVGNILSGICIQGGFISLDS